jgi:Ser/Thr protein kinase RdoA (MazF antagonist)
VLLSLLPGSALSGLLGKSGFPEECALSNAARIAVRMHQLGRRESSRSLAGFETDVAARLGLGTHAFVPAWLEQVRSVDDLMGTARLSTVRAVIEQHVDTLDGIGATCQIVHGDYQPKNILCFDDGRVGGVVDWELSCWGPPLRDIATLIRFCGSDEVEARVIAGYASDIPFPGDLRRAARCYDLIRISLGISAAGQYSDDLPDWFDYMDGCVEFLSDGSAQRARHAARRLGHV